MIHVSGHVLLTSNKDLSSFRFFGDMDVYAHQVILLKSYPQTDFFQIKENKNFYVILTAKFNAFFAGMYITCGLETLTQPGGKMRLTTNYLPLKSTTARSANVTAKSNRFTSGATTWKIPKQRAIFSAPLRSSRQLLLPYGTRDPMTQAWGHKCFLYADVDEGTSVNFGDGLSSGRLSTEDQSLCNCQMVLSG